MTEASVTPFPRQRRRRKIRRNEPASERALRRENQRLQRENERLHRQHLELSHRLAAATDTITLLQHQLDELQPDPPAANPIPAAPDLDTPPPIRPAEGGLVAGALKVPHPCPACGQGALQPISSRYGKHICDTCNRIATKPTGAHT